MDDPATGLPKHFRIRFDPRFCEVQGHEPLPSLSDEDLRRLLAEPMNLSLWTELLPPERFSFHGFVLVTAVDVTDQEELSALKDDLLQSDAMSTPERVDHLEGRLRTLVGCPDLRLGLIYLERDDLEAITAARAVGRSLLIDEAGVPVCPMKAHSAYAEALAAECEPIIVADLAQRQPRTGFEERLLAQGLRNIVLAPLRIEGRLIGLLELGVPRVGALHYLNGIKLVDAVSLFATALKRTLDEREDRVQALIKEKYTAIHPVVEWRFREAALAFMQRPEAERSGEMPPVVFPDVYPLYGLIDIRDSSTHREAAIRADLIAQLGSALDIIAEAGVERRLPVLDELAYRISGAIAAVESGPSAEDETSVLEFLAADVEPLFAQLEGFGASVRKKVAAYGAALDPALGILYRQRKDFEESVTRINDMLAAYLDEQDRQAQSMSPHYFEKYKTDGVDYNIYAGASLVERGGFTPLYLRNLRLWQLMMMCGAAWELERLKPQLKLPLSATPLVLVQSTPFAIRFRQDEKKFDVDGAYNVRYEIMKKRIDKARIRGSRERLTQPGQLAIVYSHAKEALEYRRYVDYLQAARYLTGEVEELELEGLQGLHGLKALRVTVAPEPPRPDASASLPERVRVVREAAVPV